MDEKSSFRAAVFFFACQNIIRKCSPNLKRIGPVDFSEYLLEIWSESATFESYESLGAGLAMVDQNDHEEA